MRVGVIAEGRADFAVLRCIIKAVLGLDASEVDSIRPDLQSDETSLAERSASTFSNWLLVKEECTTGTNLRAYLENLLDEQRLVVVHIDTAECEEHGFGVKRPERQSASYTIDCCEAVVAALCDWRAGAGGDRVVEAVAVEETDAWLLPHYADLARDADTGASANPKERLERALQKTREFSDKERKRILSSTAFYKYGELAKPLAKWKTLRVCVEKNASLQRFVRVLCATAERIEPGSCRIKEA